MAYEGARAFGEAAKGFAASLKDLTNTFVTTRASQKLDDIKSSTMSDEEKRQAVADLGQKLAINLAGDVPPGTIKDLNSALIQPAAVKAPGIQTPFEATITGYDPKTPEGQEAIRKAGADELQRQETLKRDMAADANDAKQAKSADSAQVDFGKQYNRAGTAVNEAVSSANQLDDLLKNNKGNLTTSMVGPLVSAMFMGKKRLPAGLMTQMGKSADVVSQVRDEFYARSDGTLSPQRKQALVDLIGTVRKNAGSMKSDAQTAIINQAWGHSALNSRYSTSPKGLAAVISGGEMADYDPSNPQTKSNHDYSPPPSAPQQGGVYGPAAITPDDGN